MENQPMLDLLWHVCFRWHLRPRQVTGDTKYGTLENVKAIEDAGMRAYIPLFNRDNEHGEYYGSSSFTYDAVHDCSICPTGQPLHLSRMEYKAEKAEYQADAATCNACPLKAECTPTTSPSLLSCGLSRTRQRVLSDPSVSESVAQAESVG